jgi:cbb3-type cytochrome oxidase cytochrome c subunit
MKGPDLAKVGKDHDKAWIADHIRDPKKHKESSKMPPTAEDKLSAKDLDTLAEYLAGLK